MIPRLILCPFACLSLSVVTGLPSPSAAHNGENTAFAIPLQEIAIDGRLHDWPADIEVYPVEWVSPFFYRETPPDGPEDFTGSFRVAYDRETSFLYVAVVVRDDELVFHPGEDIARTDACGIYVDADHSGGNLEDGKEAQLYAMVPGPVRWSTWSDGNPSLNSSSLKTQGLEGAYLHEDHPGSANLILWTPERAKAAARISGAIWCWWGAMLIGS